jgi:glycosyltransferase involved in cell wall biosynthesis
MEKISLAIPYYNNSRFMYNTLLYPSKDDRINEIIICDDKSEDLDDLNKIIKSINSDKIKVIINNENLGVYLNKIRSLKYCTNERAILFDSDNILDENYVNILYTKEWDEKTIYLSGFVSKIDDYNNVFDSFDYRKYEGVIDKLNFKDKNYNEILFKTMMNTCNYFVPVKKYIECSEKNSIEYDTKLISALDSITLLSDWLVDGNAFDVIKDLTYKHRIHQNSSYLKYANKIDEAAWINILYKKILKDG